MRWARLFRDVGAGLVLAAGVAYVVWPPMTTTSFLDAVWPPILWGIVMLAGGIVALLGRRTMKVEQWGMLAIALGTLMLALTQTMVATSPPTLTRSGGTFILWAMVAFSAARALELQDDIKAGAESARIRDQAG